MCEMIMSKTPGPVSLPRNKCMTTRRSSIFFNYGQIEKAMESAKNLSAPGDRRDYRAFKDRAISILEGHRSKAREEYEKFMDENKGKFIGSLDTSWFLILVDQDEVNNWMELFDTHASDLDELLKKHEEGFVNLKDGDLKKKLIENYNKMTNNSQEAIRNWRLGKEIYKEYERELKKMRRFRVSHG